ncbi:MAG: glycosyltransferase [Verrucomicrobia bacterium]|nr:glycosyltransferase [Verrucomicrobiota bacterium]
MKKSICLNMIVKDEADVIERCLASVKPWIDYWVIVDTGSTDGTQEKVKKCLEGIPGQLHERPWVNFEHNRNEALKLAKEKGDYLLFIDADDELKCSESFKLPELERDYYIAVQHDLGYEMDLLWVLLINSKLAWEWVGVAHETLVSPDATTGEVLSGVINLYHNDGKRSRDPKKKYNDLELLEGAARKDPTNPRNTFYLAQTYRGLQMYSEAIEVYKRRVELKGSEEEIYSSLYWIGRLQQELEMDPDLFIKSYCKAHQYNPTRIEPLYGIAGYYIKTTNYLMAYLLTSYALAAPALSPTATFVLKWMYDWGVLLEHAICCSHLGKKEELQKAIEVLLKRSDLPAHIRESLVKSAC